MNIGFYLQELQNKKLEYHKLTYQWLRFVKCYAIKEVNLTKSISSMLERT